MGKIYWAELQSQLSGAGLNVVLGVPQFKGPWGGEIDGKPFTMTISPKSEKDGLRDFMLISLFGQDEKKVIPLLTKFMEYEPFCHYKDKRLEDPRMKSSATYEWDKNDPDGRMKELQKESAIYDLVVMIEGTQTPAKLDMDRYYSQFTAKTIKVWEKAVKEQPQAEWSNNKLKDILPFVKKVMPRIGKIQSLFGLSIISLDGKSENEKAIVEYGLEPLLKANVITKEEAEKIIIWYNQTEPSWDSGGHSRRFEKTFEIGGKTYRLATDSYRNCRDLNLMI